MSAECTVPTEAVTHQRHGIYEVERTLANVCFEHQQSQLELDVVGHWQPVKLLQHRADMITWRQTHDESSCSVLDSLCKKNLQAWPMCSTCDRLAITFITHRTT